MSAPRRGAWTNFPLPMYMPTWLISSADEPKKTRSPSRRSSRATLSPVPNCSREVRGMLTPQRLYTARTNPLQSMPSTTLFPPHRYGMPTNRSAVRAAIPPMSLSGPAFGTGLAFGFGPVCVSLSRRTSWGAATKYDPITFSPTNRRACFSAASRLG